jgi:ABC-type lipoprotein release transport system permease subunit
MLSFQLGSYETMINSSVKIFAGHLQVQAKDYNDKRDIRLVVPDPAAIGRVLDKTPNVEAYTYRASAFSMVSSRDRTYGVMVVGVDPEREAGVSTLKKVIRRGAYLSEDDYEGALVGERLAENLQVDVGDELTMLGQGRDGSVAATLLTVRGIYKSGLTDFHRSSVQITLEGFQAMFSMRGAAHEVVAIAKSLRHVAAIRRHPARHGQRSDFLPDPYYGGRIQHHEHVPDGHIRADQRIRRADGRRHDSKAADQDSADRIAQHDDGRHLDRNNTWKHSDPILSGARN